MKPWIIGATIIVLFIAVIMIFSATNHFGNYNESNNACDGCNNGCDGCNNTTNDTANQTIENPNQKTVLIHGSFFDPLDLAIKAGTTVKWVNRNKNYHQITSNDGTFQSPILHPGEEYSFYFDQPGDYGYHCALHPGEVGKITVYA